jgi:hypothetical protein
MAAFPLVSTPTVAELQGLYGAYGFPEKLLQKIWLQGEFNRAAAVTVDGRRVRIVQPGRWNLLGGPDFTDARLRFDEPPGPEVRGDVEVHLRAPDWDAHGHAHDPAYDRVVLHVVLFPPAAGRVTRGAGGREIPVLVLLPLLLRGLEEFAADDAVETLANRPLAPIPDELAQLPEAEVTAILQRHAAERWRQKVRFARLRVERLGWDEACHQTALEILGYRFNRTPMLRLAAQWPLEPWVEGSVDVDVVYATEREHWSLQGVRPANQPRTRLRQYAAWTRARPDWPGELRRLAVRLPRADRAGATTSVRRQAHLGALRGVMAEHVGANAVRGTRLDTLICDGWLPLLAAGAEAEAESVWYHWFPGDLPAGLRRGLRQLGYFDARRQPSCHGVAQGLLGWWLAREPRS